MAVGILQPPTQNALQKQLNADLNTGATTSLTLNNTTGIQNKPGLLVVNRIDSGGNVLAAAGREYIQFTGTSGATLTGLTRAMGGSTDQDHATGEVVEFINDVVQQQAIIDTFDVDHDIDTGTHKLTQLLDTSGNETIKTPATASAVNEITVTNAATTTAPTISATGGDTNIDLKLIGKGTGNAQAYSEYDAQYFDIVPNYSMARQAIMNGNFDVWQRGTSVAVTAAASTFLADRWRETSSVDGGTNPTLTRSRQALTPGDIFNAFYYSRLATNGAGSSYGNDSRHFILQPIEHGTRLLCGDGKKVTVSFWAKSDIANKKIGITLNQNYGTGGSPTSDESINGTNWTLTSTWTKYTHTFTTNTLASKTFGTANDDSLRLSIYYMWGTNYDDKVGATTAETFVGSGNIDIAQVQLCAGEVALPFQAKSYAQELADCQRYYFRITPAASSRMGTGFNTSTTVGVYITNFPVILRTAPSAVEQSGTATDYSIAHTNTTTACSAVPEFSMATTYSALTNLTVASGLTAGQGSAARAVNTSAYLGWSAEL